MKILTWQNLSPSEQKQSLRRPAQSQSEDLRKAVQDILTRVRAEGDQALLSYTESFDKIRLASMSVSAAERAEALAQLSPRTWDALRIARDNIERFHRQQTPKRIELPVLPGIRCFREPRALERVGFYIPGGSAPLPSTVLMLGIPSLIAGNPIRVLCTPPQKDGKVNPIVLAAAELCGIETIYKVGGAQAIAAMAYGTDTIPKVDKIFGPGNAWVTEAKMQVMADPEGAAIDMPAGPSEVLVIADESASAAFVAADLLSQAEHGPDSQVILISTSETKAREVLAALDRQIMSLPRREIAIAALNNSRCILADDLATALKISDAYAPEHLILQVQDPERWAREVQHAGSVFLGPWSPESAGDYASGTNHVLPTYGYARSYSGLTVESFMKFISFQHLSREGLEAIGPAIEELADLEGLEAHRRAVSLRLRPEEQL